MIMKLRNSLWILSVAVFFAACQKDNYSAPKTTLSGALLYQGDTLYMGAHQVTFQLWQSGFGKMTPINVNVDQNGSYSSLLFDGTYQLVIPSGQGPFIADNINSATPSDTLTVQLHGNTKQDIEVLPYYLIQAATFSLEGGSVKAQCDLQQVITDDRARPVESLILYVNKTQFVDNNYNIATMALSGSDVPIGQPVDLQVAVPDMTPTQDYVFARIGLKIQNVEDMLFSRVVKIQLP